MSNQTLTDKQLRKLSFDELKKIISEEKKGLKKDIKESEKKRKLIEKYRNWQKLEKRLNKEKI